MSSLAHVWGLLLASVLPHIEDPWPDRIGLGLPIATAGAGGVLAGVIHAESPAATRDRAIGKGALFGFRAGAAVYLLSLAVQVGSSI